MSAEAAPAAGAARKGGIHRRSHQVSFPPLGALPLADADVDGSKSVREMFEKVRAAYMKGDANEVTKFIRMYIDKGNLARSIYDIAASYAFCSSWCIKNPPKGKKKYGKQALSLFRAYGQ
jgi:hypothetical protein